MPIKSRTYLKSKFDNGDIPTQDDFADIIDSYIHEEEDGITIYNAPDLTVRVGIGIDTPESPLGILGTGEDQTMISFHKPDGSSVWSLNQNPTALDVPGFNIQQKVGSLKLSRFFVKESDGHIGIGTTNPSRILEVSENNADGVTAIKLKNTATSVAHPGWLAGHVNKEALGNLKNGAFSFLEESSTTPLLPVERMTILPGGNVGINELLPDTKLHVVIPEANANAPVALLPNSGIAQFGPITKSIIADFQGIQARKGVYDTSTPPLLALTPSALHLQNLGGDILVHGSTTSGLTDLQRAVIKESGKVGLGLLTPAEQLHVNGRIIVGDRTSTEADVDGSIRFTSGPVKIFEGWNGTAWIPFGGDETVWEFTTNDNIRFIPTEAYVGIGISGEPTAQLDVLDNTIVETAGTETAVKVSNTSQFKSVLTGEAGEQPLPTPGSNDNRIGLEINSNPWNGNTNAKDIGLLVSNVAGQSAANRNLAAVFNGNVVVGGITAGVDMIGTNGSKVLALQNGTAPTAKIPGTQTIDSLANTNANGVQVYSALTGATGAKYSTFHVMNGNGSVINLYKASAISVKNSSTISTTTYNATVANVINNMRTRINDLEARLISAGLLATSSISDIIDNSGSGGSGNAT
jgi:hypothetical protein